MRFTLLASLLALLPSIASAQGPLPSIIRSTAPASAIVHDAKRIHLSNLPIVFEENRGQSKAADTYLTRISGSSMGFASSRIEWRLPEESTPLELSFSGSAQPLLTAHDLTGGESNYLVGSSRHDWLTHVPQFARVIYSNLYPGVDLTFYGNGSELEHDFIVAPGVDYRIIRMHYNGARSLSLNSSGALILQLDHGAVEIKAPLIYQMNGAERELRNGSFVLLSSKEVSFRVDQVDSTRPLIIDPVLNYSTYLSTASMNVDGVAVDNAGNTYVLGDTTQSYPVTSSAYQKSCVSCPNQTDLIITKLNAAGTAQIYSTYIGGSDHDRGIRIAVDANGNAIVAGMTYSNDFPLANPVQTPGNAAAGDAFVSSLSPDGSSLNFSSRLGSRPGDSPVGISRFSAWCAHYRLVVADKQSGRLAGFHALRQRLRLHTYRRGVLERYAANHHIRQFQPAGRADLDL